MIHRTAVTGFGRATFAAVAFVLAGAAYGQDSGQIEFNNHCRTCHTVDEGDHRLGPSLHGVVGREAGSLPEYAYSDAMRSSSIVWDEQTLERFIENPDAIVPGNKMQPYSGVADPEIRSAIVAYLAAQSP